MTIYNLARGGTTTWPFMVDYAPGRMGGEFCLSSGDGRNGNGTFLSPSEALLPQWRRDVEEAGALWLVPLWERMVAGELLGVAEILVAYNAVYGSEPRAEQWRDC